MKIRLYDENKLRYAINLAEVEKRVMYDVNVKEEGEFTFKRIEGLKNYLVVYSDKEFTFKVRQEVGVVSIEGAGNIAWKYGVAPNLNKYSYLQLEDISGEIYGRLFWSGTEWLTELTDLTEKIVIHEQIYRGKNFIIPLIDWIDGKYADNTWFQLIDNINPVMILQGYDEES